MNLPQLYYFKKLAEVQHYTRAAKELYITQPTLSNSISQLERELGIPLFERENRAVKLTRYGKEFYEHITEALDALDKGVDIAHERAGSLSGSIELGTVYTVQGDYLPALLAGFHNQYGQNISVNISQGLTLPLIDGLEKDEYEVVFSAYVPNKPTITFHPILYQQLVLIMSPDHPLAHYAEVPLEELKTVSHVMTYPPETPIGQMAAKVLDEHGVTAAKPYYNDEITLASMVATDPECVGVAVNSIGLVPFKQDLVIKRIKGLRDDFYPTCLAYKTSAFKTRALENFIEYTKSFTWGNAYVLPRVASTDDEAEDTREPHIIAPFSA